MEAKKAKGYGNARIWVLWMRVTDGCFAYFPGVFLGFIFFLLSTALSLSDKR